jgi:hypothetical protein
VTPEVIGEFDDDVLDLRWQQHRHDNGSEKQEAMAPT